MDKTSIFNVKELRQELIIMMLNEVIESLEFKGYNPTKQLAGYLLTGDLKYITSFNDARKKIASYDKTEVMMTIINNFIGK